MQFTSMSKNQEISIRLRLIQPPASNEARVLTASVALP
jgi:hypothetical protein